MQSRRIQSDATSASCHSALISCYRCAVMCCLPMMCCDVLLVYSVVTWAPKSMVMVLPSPEAPKLPESSLLPSPVGPEAPKAPLKNTGVGGSEKDEAIDQPETDAVCFLTALLSVRAFEGTTNQGPIKMQAKGPIAYSSPAYALSYRTKSSGCGAELFHSAVSAQKSSWWRSASHAHCF